MSTCFDRARQRLDKAFGIGVEEAHHILRRNAEAKRIYDCALHALAEQEQALADWLTFQIKHEHAPDGAPIEMDELYAKRRKVAFEAVMRKFAPDEGQ
ncbi:hypothetical protein KNJ79_05015 [Sphingopyxis indica]|uniref:hypothetical protein n=1 Tax=Sphingopyxis indica TaxID=436663 RepID=UPI002938FF03|nr:hypothetical protein [Sphingopyxis indica]WOF44292.1 hypothetical protein KNJ79_05015 [Sphingopyxis indica]